MHNRFIGENHVFKGLKGYPIIPPSRNMGMYMEMRITATRRADEHDQGGFEERAHAADLVFEFVGEGVALAAEHFGKAVGLLADTDQGREFAVVQRGETRHAGREEFAVLQAAADRGERLPVGIEADYVGEHPHAREQRNPGRAEQVKQFTELRLVVFADNRARNGQTQHEFRSPSLYLLSVSVGI